MMDVVAIDRPVAQPFVHAACVRYNLAFDPDSGNGVVWWGCIERSTIKAIAGWSPSLDDAIILTGPFGNGSRFEEFYMNELMRAMSVLDTPFVVIPASPSLYIRRKSTQLERYGILRTPPMKAH